MKKKKSFCHTFLKYFADPPILSRGGAKDLLPLTS